MSTSPHAQVGLLLTEAVSGEQSVGGDWGNEQTAASSLGEGSMMPRVFNEETPRLDWKWSVYDLSFGERVSSISRRRGLWNQVVDWFSGDAGKLISRDQGQLDSGLDSMPTSRPEVFSLVGDGSAAGVLFALEERDLNARLLLGYQYLPSRFESRS